MRSVRTERGERLDPEAVARVLRRATELSADDVEPDGIDPEALVAAADEAGIPVVAVRRALAIERLGPPPAAQVGDLVLGPPVVVVDAEVPGHATDALSRIDAWLVAGHHLRRERRRDRRAEFARRKGLVGRTMRTVRSATGEGQLGRLHRVVAAAEDTGAGTCIVRIEADRSTERRTMAGEGAAVTAVGTLGAARRRPARRTGGARRGARRCARRSRRRGQGSRPRRSRGTRGRIGPRRRRAGERPDPIGDRRGAPRVRSPSLTVR